VLLGLQCRKQQRRPWRQLLVCGGSLTAALLLTSSPYVVATHRLTNKPSGSHLLGRDLPQPDRHDPLQQSQAGAARPLLASTLAITLNAGDSWSRRAVKAVWYLGSELVKCFHYATWMPVLLGVWWFRRRVWLVPGMWVLLVVCGLMILVLCRLAVVDGYMSDRHLMVLVLCGCYAAAAAFWELPCRAAAWLRRQPWTDTARRAVPHTSATAALAVLLFSVAVASGMPKTLEPLHGNRAGHHAAGLWLRAH